MTDHLLQRRDLHPILRSEPPVRPSAFAKHHQWPAEWHRRPGLQWLGHWHFPRAVRPIRSPRVHEHVLDRAELSQPRPLGRKLRTRRESPQKELQNTNKSFPLPTARILQTRHLLLHLQRPLLRPRIHPTRRSDRLLRDRHPPQQPPQHPPMARDPRHRPLKHHNLLPLRHRDRPRVRIRRHAFRRLLWPAFQRDGRGQGEFG